MTGTSPRRARLAWAFYDWGNSAFATTVMAGFFPVFFKQYWCAGVDVNVSTARLGLANALSGVLVAIAAPLLGAIADQRAARKRFLAFFAGLGVASTCGLFLVREGGWLAAAVLYVTGAIGFACANIFYDSLLPVVAEESRYDMVSALGFSLGYLGGGLLFTGNVLGTLHPGWLGMTSAAAAIRIAFLTTGIWWAVFTIPLLVYVREPRRRSPARSAARNGWRQVAATLRHIRSRKIVFLFLAGYWLYMDGVDTIIRMAVDYGMSIGFDSKDLIMALLLTQFIGFPAALGFGWLGKRLGPKRGVLLGIAVYLCVSVWGAFMHHRAEFYLLAVVIGLVQGGVQALSRSMFVRLIPRDKSAEYFGFYNLVGKFATIVGPVLVGVAGLAARGLGATPATASRLSIASLSILFLAGGIILWKVDEEQGRRERDEPSAWMVK
ncbi:MFS transporter [bacterium]|nr:MFS transporter [candidate division CSSED10-310 bacterium]